MDNDEEKSKIDVLVLRLVRKALCMEKNDLSSGSFFFVVRSLLDFCELLKWWIDLAKNSYFESIRVGDQIGFFTLLSLENVALCSVKIILTIYSCLTIR